MTPATIVAALTSRKGLVLLVPAILLVGTVLAIGRNQTTAAETPKDEQTPPPTVTVVPAPPKTAVAETALSGAQRKEIEGIVKEYLIKNPEILVEMQNALEAKEYERQAKLTAAVIKENAKAVFQPASSPIVGNSKGDVTVLEFFDYNCGYCKRALVDVARLIEKDKQVKVILKELPILSEGSKEAAKVALAAKMQGKYWEFHRAMLESTGQANEASALRTAEKLGLDMAKLKKDMASPAVQKEIEDTQALAKKLFVNGTPYFLIADKIIPGAPENLLDRMTKLVAEVRKEGCKVC
jgi:protein-disulfide isomerase